MPNIDNTNSENIKSVYDPEKVRQNVTKLMESRTMTQKELADIIDSSQPNVHRALKVGGKQQFTLTQIFKIAQEFDVTVDWILGCEKEKPIAETYTEICQTITHLLEERKLVQIQCSREEEVYTPFRNRDGYPDTMRSKKNVVYPAFIFPEYWDYGPSLNWLTEEQRDNIQYDIDCFGNAHESNQLLNEFFKKYEQIYNMYLNGQMPLELFHEIKAKFMADLK